MASPLGITTRKANCNAFSADNPKTLRMCCSICFESLDTCTHLHSRAMIRSPVIVHEFSVFQVVCPDAECAFPGRFAEVASNISTTNPLWCVTGSDRPLERVWYLQE